MGSRSANETAVRIFQAFLRKGTWSQAALAREVGIQPPQLKRLLEGMERDSVLPLERDEEHPHVYWSVPEGWFPGGVFYQGTEVETLLRLLARSPKSKERDRLIAIANQCLDGRRDLGVMLTEVVRTTQPSASETANQVWVERSAVEKKPLHARYYSTRGNEGWRHISVQRVTPETSILLFHFSGSGRAFSVFVHEVDAEIVGIVVVRKSSRLRLLRWRRVRSRRTLDRRRGGLGGRGETGAIGAAKASGGSTAGTARALGFAVSYTPSFAPGTYLNMSRPPA